MTYNKYIIIFFLFFNQFCFTQNLIQNGSFEDSLGNPSLNGWIPSIYDSFFVNSSSDVPLGGENWSLKLLNVNAANYVIWFINGMQGAYVYNFSVYAKDEQCTGTAVIGIGLVQNFQPAGGVIPFPPSWLTQEKMYNPIPVNWTKIILIDTITSNASDSIAVILSAGVCPVGGNYVYYDNVELTIDSLTSTQNTLQLQSENIKIYPNPFDETATIQITNGKTANYELKIFDVFGREVYNKIIRNSPFVIHRGNLISGIYFLKLQTAEKIYTEKIIIQ